MRDAGKQLASYYSRHRADRLRMCAAEVARAGRALRAEQVCQGASGGDRRPCRYGIRGDRRRLTAHISIATVVAQSTCLRGALDRTLGEVHEQRRDRHRAEP